MARHRNIRSMNYEEDFDDYTSDEFGTSLDNGCITPETENMYTYARERHESVSKIWEPQQPPVREEDEETPEKDLEVEDVIDTGQIPIEDQGKLFDCLETMRSVIGDSVPEAVLREAALSQNFDADKALNVVFDRQKNPSKPQKKPVTAIVSSPQDPLTSLLNGENFSIDDLLNAPAALDPLMAVLGESSFASQLPTNEVPAIDLGALLNVSSSADVKPIGSLMEAPISTYDIFGDAENAAPSLDLRQFLNDTSQKNDVLDELMRRVDCVEAQQGSFTSPSSTSVSAVRTILQNLRNRNGCDLRGVLDWYKRYLNSRDQFSFREPSPDDVVRSAMENKVFGESRKAQTGQSKRTETTQHTYQTVPPIDVPTRITFNGKDSAPKNPSKAEVKAGDAKPAKDSAVGKDPTRRKLSPDTPKAAVSPKPARNPKMDPKAIQDLYEKERTSMKPLLNLVVVGHVDAGKSTLMGHLLYLTGNVSRKTMAKYEHESKKQGKASFAYAWVLDETSEERARGITMDMAYAKLQTENRCINILDAPGHKDFIPNMITGAAQADVAILVINATKGEFETGFELGGQTREHTMLVRSLGVSQLSVAVNKLDTCQWSEKRFNEIVATLKPFLKQTGFADSLVSFVPCSGLSGVNLNERSELPELTKWYKGPCLLETVDKMEPPPRPITRPLRMCVADVFKGMQSGVCVSGKIESGCMSQGDKLVIMPSQEPCVIRSMLIDDFPHNRAYAGDSVLVNLDKCDPAQIAVGSVVCDPNEPIRSVTKFEAKVVIFNIDIPIIKGSPVVLHFQSLSEQAFFGKLVKELNRNTGEVVREKPRFLSKNSSGVVVIKVARPICVELYQDSKELGRITLRQAGQTIAAGVVTALL